MAATPISRIALMSIRPEFCRQIFTGRKRVELRRKAPKSPLSHVVVYESAPTSRIIGYFTVSRTVNDKPSSLWQAYGRVAGISRKRFNEYFAGCDEGSAIIIGCSCLLEVPLALNELSPKLHPPQSFMYLPSRFMKRFTNQQVNLV